MPDTYTREQIDEAKLWLTTNDTGDSPSQIKFDFLQDVDWEIRPIVAALNSVGVKTVASCSGHGYRPGSIALSDGRELIIARNYKEARKIDSLFPLNIHGEPIPTKEVGR